MAWQGANAAPVSPRQSGYATATPERDYLVPTLRLGFAPPETGDKNFLIVECDCDKEFLIGGIPIAGDGQSVALGPAASPLLRVRRFARPSAADRPGVPALPASRWRAKLLAASGEEGAMCGRASPGATCHRA
jgi:hypothetical protein